MISKIIQALLNNSLRVANTRSMKHRWQNARECSKKHALSLSEGSVQQGRSRVDARSVRCVRERERREERQVCEPEGRQHGENAAGLSACGTHGLATVFNIPIHVLVLVVLSLSSGDGAAAKEQNSRSHGATVKGQIIFNGGIPQPERISVRRDAQFCGPTIERSPVVVDPDSKGVAHVVVSIEGIPGMTPPRPHIEPISLVNQQCQFIPHTQVAVINSQLEISSKDPVLHNTHIRTESRTFLNVALPPKSRIIRKSLKSAGRLTVRCDAHKFMQSSIHVFPHPYFSLTDGRGVFEIPHVPAGTYELHVWHETFGLQIHPIAIPSSGHVTINLELPPAQ